MTDHPPEHPIQHPEEGDERADRVLEAQQAGNEPDGADDRGAGHGGSPTAVVGIGASAGGLSALRTLLEAVPAESRLAFVVVVHLAPDRESNLAEILQHSTALPVRQVQAFTALEAGHVYVIPPGKNISLTDTHVDLSSFEEPRGRRAPIDHFFRTLAEVHPDGIGVILSGGGTDGAVGMKMIKERGGLLMVQAPEEAEYDAMPRAAIDTGLVDFVLPARELADKLVEVEGRSGLRILPESPEALAEEEETVVRRILAHVRARTGHDFSGYKRSTMLRRLGRRAQVTGAENLESYLQLLRSGEGESEALVKDLLISVTNFFRDAEAFEMLAEQVIPALFEGKKEDEAVRVWVAGCATGEEAYSIAILLLEEAHRRTRASDDASRSAPKIQVFASDLDAEALAYGREGLYPESIAADVSEERLVRFFTKEGAYYRVRRDLRERVLFAQHSVLKDPPFSHLGLVTCRNLMIYLQRDLQDLLLNVFHYALDEEGYLFLGSAESAEGSGLFEEADKARRLYRRRRTPAGRLQHLPELPLEVRRGGVPQRPISPRAEAGRGVLPDGERHRRALEDKAPPSILVGTQEEVIHVSETAGRYLQVPAGRLTASATMLVRPELLVELRAALHEALGHGRATLAPPVVMQIEGEERYVQLFVRPAAGEGEASSALVFFLEAEAGRSTSPLSAAEAEASGAAPRTQQTEDALERTKKQLRETIERSETQQEELRASNEELQSINEEYKSTLEELETSKEELQSVNEELKTVNTELADKVERLSRANDDLRNLMEATSVATLFVDRELKIQLYTPALERFVNIRPVDEGRPLGDLTHRLSKVELQAEARQVLQRLVPVEREVRSEDGGWHLMRLTPYRTSRDRIDGVALTFVDITAVKQAEEELRRSEEEYRALVAASAQIVWTTDAEGRVVEDSPSWRTFTGQSREEWMGRGWLDAVHPDDRERAGENWRRSVEEGSPVDTEFRLRHAKSGDWRWTSVRAVPLAAADGAVRGWVGMNIDIHERKEAEAALRRFAQDLEHRVEERTAQVRKLSSRLTMAEQRERHRVSFILHDDLQQILFGLQIQLGILKTRVGEGAPEGMAEAVDRMGEILARALSVTRTLAIDLSPPVLVGEGLVEAISWLAAQMQELHGFTVDIETDGPVHLGQEGMRVLLFNFVRELLLNVVNHAETDTARVTIRRRRELLRITVEDEGGGFDVEAEMKKATGQKGLGLPHLRERLALFDGHLEVQSETGVGSRATIVLPLAAGGVREEAGAEHDEDHADFEESP